MTPERTPMACGGATLLPPSRLSVPSGLNSPCVSASPMRPLSSSTPHREMTMQEEQTWVEEQKKIGVPISLRRSFGSENTVARLPISNKKQTRRRTPRASKDAANKENNSNNNYMVAGTASPVRVFDKNRLRKSTLRPHNYVIGG
jgi:hypothetical protein